MTGFGISWVTSASQTKGGKYQTGIIERENLYKVGSSLKRLKRAETHLWYGDIESALAEFDDSKVKQKQLDNFRNYLYHHQERIPDYSLYQLLYIPIGSGAVESLIKRINQRVKITGDQWKSENISQILKLRCAYLNSHGCLSNYTLHKWDAPESTFLIVCPNTSLTLKIRS